MNGTEVSIIRAIRGPVTLITVGVLFALNNFTPYRFDQTWPVLLIVFGLLSLLRRGIEPRVPTQPAGAPPWGYAGPPPFSGNYRQSSYPGTGPEEPAASAPQSTAKGGFGSTAPSRPDEAAPPPGGSQ